MSVTGYLHTYEGWAKNYTSYSTGVSDLDWSNPTHITGIPDYLYSTVAGLSPTVFSEFIKGRKFDLSVPYLGDSGVFGTVVSTELSGIATTLYSYSKSGIIGEGYTRDAVVFFCGTGVATFDPSAMFPQSTNLVGKNGSPDPVWPSASGGFRVFSYQGSADLQALSLSGGPGLLNHENFGVAVKAWGSGNGVGMISNIDAIYLAVTMYIVESGLFGDPAASGYLNSSGNNPTLFIRGFDYSSGSVPLFLQADDNCERTYGPKYATGIYTTCGGGEFAWVTPSAVMVSDNIRATSDITTPDGNTCRLDVMNFRFDEVPDNFQVEGIKFTVEKKQNVGDLSVLDKEIYIIKSGEIQTYENKANGILWPESEVTPLDYGDSTDRWGVPFWSAADIRASGFGVSIKAWSSGGVGTAFVDSISCTVYGTVPCVHSGIPFYIRGFGPSGELPLYMYSTAPNSGNITLFINTVYSGDIPLSIWGNVANSGSIPLFLANQRADSGIPLYINGVFSASRGATLFAKADDAISKVSGIPLVMPYASTGVGTYSTHFAPLFISARNHPQDMTLYIQVANSANVSGNPTLYINGGTYSTSSVIPLFLANSGINSNVPLFIEGQKLTPYNPFAPSDGFYIYSGGVSLFIDRPIQEGLGLFVGSYLDSGNLPLYLQGTYGTTSGIPLFMATSVSGTSPIILYTNGY